MEVCSGMSCHSDEENEDCNVLETSCITGKMKDPFNIVTSSIYGRRTMVNKLRCQEIAQKWFWRKAEPPHGRTFSEPKAHTHVTTWYLLYRWLIFAAWFAIIICSLFSIGSYEATYHIAKWPIYLTNWELVLGFSQTLLGAFLVSKRWNMQKLSSFNPCDIKLGRIERFYWFLYVVSSIVALGVTSVYWGLVHDPKVHNVDPLNIFVHICNSILVLVDLFVTAVPFKLRNVWWCLSIVLFYIVFSVIYHAAGGVDKHGNHYIYKVLDWRKAGRTILVCIGGLTYTAVLYSIVCLLSRLRDKCYVKIAKKEGRMDLPTPNNNHHTIEKQSEVV